MVFTTFTPMGRPRPVILDGDGDHLVPLVVVAREFHVTRRTISRWIEDSQLNFPAVLKIRERGYVSRAQLEGWKLARARAPIGENAA